MKKIYLFMLMAVGLLISTTMFAAPERPVPPEPQAPEGIEMPKFERQTPVLQSRTSAAQAPHRAAMEDIMLTVYRGGESIDYPYTNEGLAAFQNEMADGDSIVLKMGVNTFFNLEKNVVLNLNGYYLYSTSSYVIYVEATGRVKVMNGYIDSSGKTYGIYVKSGNVTLENLIYEQDYWAYYAIYEAADNGCSITIDGEDTYIYGKYYDILPYGTNSTITINNGTIESPYNVVYGTSTTDTLIINGGTLINTPTASYTMISFPGKVEVNGGTFSNSDACNVFYQCTRTIRGGTFKTNTETLEPGYVYVKNADGTYTVKKSVASIEGSNDTFETLADAIAAAPENGIVTMLVGVNEQVTVNKPLTICTTNSSAPSTTVVFSGKITADGAKVILKGTGSIAAFEEINGGKIEIVSGTFVQDPSQNLAKGSKVLDGTEYKVSPVAATIGDVQYMSLQDAFTNAVSSDVIVVANDLEDVITSGAYVTFNQDKTITLDLNGKRVNILVDDQLQGASHYFINQSKGNLTITDSNADEKGNIGFEVVNSKTLGSTGEYMFRVAGTAVLNINRGTLESKTKTGCVIANNIELCSKTAVCNVTGGTIVAQGMANCARVTGGTFNISGGHFIVSEDNGNAIIFVQEANAKQENPIVSINITGGTFENLYAKGVVICCWANGNNQLQNVRVDISGGKFASTVILFTLNGGNGTYWGGADWERESWNNVYRDIFHATGGQFANGDFCINGTVDDTPVRYTKSLAEILDSYYNLKDNTQVSTEYPLTIGPKEITESTGDGNWNELFPNSEGENIQVEHQVTVVEGYTEAYSLDVQPTGEVIVKEGATLDLTWGLVMDDGAKMTIEPGAAVIVGVAGIQNTSNSRIVVQTGLEHSGILSVDPEAFLFSDPYIRVEYTTAAYRTTKNEQTWYKWQDFGIPTRKAPNFVAIEPTTSIMRWNVVSNEYEPVNNSTMLNEPFRGYIITNQLSEPGFTYVMTGRMNAAENQKFNFAVTQDPEKENFNFFANSYLTPMDIKTFLQGLTDEDNNIERTVHVFNSGTDTYESINLSDLKFNLADFTTIAPMQAFYMSTKNKVAAQATLNYRNSVWGQTSTEPMHAPQRVQNDANVFNLYAGTGKAKDKLSFIESSNFTAEYENGYDAVKYMNKDFNIFVATERGKQSIVATDNIEGTILTFQAGDAVEYQLSFDRVQCDEYSIMDLMTGRSVDVSEGNTYNFVAEPKSTEARFQIIPKTPWVATGVDEVSEKTNSKGIYTILGQYVGSSAEWDKLSAGVYIVDGIKIVK